MSNNQKRDKKQREHIVMVSAECAGLAQRGGLAGVVKDLSHSLIAHGFDVSIILPYYDVIETKKRFIRNYTIDFGGRFWDVEIYETTQNWVTIYLLKNEEFFTGSIYGDVYVDSGKLGHGVFEDDAKRFAFFSKTALEFIKYLDWIRPVSALHCHDWHTALVLLLLKHDPMYRDLARKIPTVFTIHNLDYQGTRPLELSHKGDLLTFSEWFPYLYQQIKFDSNFQDYLDRDAEIPCINLMRTAINTADKVNTVSKAYAEEITQSDNPEVNFKGGRGLEEDLKKLLAKGHLKGILNGIDYDFYNPLDLPPGFDPNESDWPVLKETHKVEFLRNLEHFCTNIISTHKADTSKNIDLKNKLRNMNMEEWIKRPLLVGVTRMADQKISLLLENNEIGSNALTEILNQNVSVILMGQGDLDEIMQKQISAHQNALIIMGFEPELEKHMYSSGDMFLMPSDFEPCGTSQMKAMRYGSLPIVSNVGGLRETVRDNKTGFIFKGVHRKDQAKSLVETVDKAIKLYNVNQNKWMNMQELAMQDRFDWEKSVKEYLKLYRYKTVNPIYF